MPVPFWLERGARVVLGGIPASDRIVFRASTVRRKGLTIAMVRRMNDVYPRAISLVAAGRIDVSTPVTYRLDLTAPRKRSVSRPTAAA